MIDPKNTVLLTGRLVADPEIKGDVVLTFRMALDYSGQDASDKDNKSGFFNIKYFLNNDNSNVSFVRNQVNEGNIKKGSTVQLVGRVVQERWKTDQNEGRSSVVIYAESLTYGGSKPAADGQPQATAKVPDEF